MMCSSALNILVAPLNWGLGHATRCVPIIDRYLSEGHRVTIGGDGESLLWLRRRYPNLPYVELASLRLHYGRGRSQVGTLLLQLPHILSWLIRDHKRMNEIQKAHHFDLIISDNRFALFLDSEAITRSQTITSAALNTIYITHQLYILLPRSWRWLEPLAQRAHAYFINRYTRCWVPDVASSPGWAGALSHPSHLSLYTTPIEYLGPLSRFATIHHPPITTSPPSTVQSPLPEDGKGAVLLLSGLEPQRSLLRDDFLRTYPEGEVIEGCIDDAYIARRLCSARTIVARSGYSTGMDLLALGLFDSSAHRVCWVPTPGQPEQEYLAVLWGHQPAEVVN